MELHHLRIFASVYGNRSFSKASKELNISQPTISEHIKNLEAELGCQLFDRLGRTIAPTKEAELMYPGAMHIIEAADRLKETVASASGAVRGEIAIGASTIPGSYILPGICNAFRAGHPEVSFRVLIEDSQKITDMVLRHEVLVGFVGSVMEPDKLKATAFYEDELVMAASPALDIKSPLGVKALSEVPFILREEGSGTRKTMEGYLKNKGLLSPDGLNVSAVLGSTDAVKQSVKASLGVSALSRIAIKEDLALGTLKEIKVRGLKMTRSFYIISHKRRVLPSPYSVFLKFLKAHLA